MIFVKTSGECSNGITYMEEELLEKSGCKTLEDALIKLGYHYTLGVGTEDAFNFELHINDDQDTAPAAIGFMNFIGTYEMYAFESKHAALVFLKEYHSTIITLDEQSKIEE